MSLVRAAGHDVGRASRGGRLGYGRPVFSPPSIGLACWPLGPAGLDCVRHEGELAIPRYAARALRWPVLVALLYLAMTGDVR
jgi:hypothetical protein